MNAVIKERLRVDARCSVVIVDERLTPGEEVEVTVRPVPVRAEGAAQPGLWELASRMTIDAPADYSVNFEQTMR